MNSQLSGKQKNQQEKLTEDLHVLLILDAGFVILLLMAFIHGQWENFFGGLAGGLFFNTAFFRDYISKKKKVLYK